MKQIPFGKSGMQVPVVAVGCMRICDLTAKDAAAHLAFCLENGMNFFDHADIYGAGKCERRFAEAVREIGCPREKLTIQSKCGIVPGVMYDFSCKHILQSVDGILERLGTDYLDVLVLHRPDALMEPEEVAAAFDRLETSGKVRRFGVSNHRPGQIALLKKYVKQEIATNQLQFSLPFSDMVSVGMEANMQTDGAVDRSGDALNYCRLHDITIQAWSPFQYGFFAGAYIGNTEKFEVLNLLLEELSEKYSATPTAVAASWILRHPAKIQMIAGTTSIKRMQEIVRGSEITLQREDWYRLYLSSGHILP